MCFIFRGFIQKRCDFSVFDFLWIINKENQQMCDRKLALTISLFIFFCGAGNARLLFCRNTWSYDPLTYIWHEKFQTLTVCFYYSYFLRWRSSTDSIQHRLTMSWYQLWFKSISVGRKRLFQETSVSQEYHILMWRSLPFWKCNLCGEKDDTWDDCQ